MKELIPLLAALMIVAPLRAAEPVPPSAAQSSVMAEGVVRKIDAANGRITLKHGPIASLDMPGMTMVFRLQSPELLSGLKVGDRVRFRAETVNGNLTVTAIQSAE